MWFYYKYEDTKKAWQSQALMGKYKVNLCILVI